jgi:hypothetical protein
MPMAPMVESEHSEGGTALVVLKSSNYVQQTPQLEAGPLLPLSVPLGPLHAE